MFFSLFKKNRLIVGDFYLYQSVSPSSLELVAEFASLLVGLEGVHVGAVHFDDVVGFHFEYLSFSLSGFIIADLIEFVKGFFQIF